MNSYRADPLTAMGIFILAFLGVVIGLALVIGLAASWQGWAS